MEVSLVASFLNGSKIVNNMLGNQHLVVCTHTSSRVTMNRVPTVKRTKLSGRGRFKEELHR